MRPDLRARVKFTEVTTDGILRHPVYLGMEDAAPRSGRAGAVAAVQPTSPLRAAASPLDLVSQQLDVLDRARRDGRIALPDGGTLDVTNLAKVFWATQQFTKGDLLRYYARVSPLILPAVTGRPW